MKLSEIVKNEENVSILIEFAQYQRISYNCIVEYYAHANPIKENIFLSSLISLRNGFVFGTNICIPFENELEMNILGSISDELSLKCSIH